MNDLRAEILMQLTDKLSKKNLDKVVLALDTTLHNYNIEAKSRELALYDTTNDRVLKAFLSTKKLEGKSVNTLKQYNYILTQLFSGLGTSVRDITTEDIRNFLATYQTTKDISLVSLDNMRSIYSLFFKWCEIEGYINTNPMLRISPFKVPKKMVHAFTETELDMLASQCTSFRDRAIIEFFYSTGVRATECSDMNICDIDFDRKLAIVNHGKGDEEGIVYISDKCMYHLKQYLEYERGEYEIDDPLFVGKKGRLTRSGLEYIITKLGNSAGIHAHPHKFRHSFGTHMTKRGVGIQIVQKAMRHRNIESTMVYVETANAEVQNAHSRVIA